MMSVNIHQKHKHIKMEIQNSFLSLLFLFMVILILRISKPKNSTPSYPPGPWKLPLIGNIHQLLGPCLPHHRLRDLANKYGPLMYLKLGQVHHIIISSPEAAKEVMKTHDISFSNRPSILPARIILYDSRDIGFAPYGDYWRQMRKICTLELLSAKRVQSFASIRQEAMSDLIKKISSRAPSPVNLSKMLFSLNYSIISKAVFGKVPKEQEAEFIRLVELISDVGSLTLADLFPSIKLLEKVSGAASRMEKLHQKTDEMLENIINEHRSRRTMANNGNGREVVDLVDVLLDVQEQSKLDIPLETDDIKAVILDMFIAGSETASTLLDWVMSELLRHPRMMEKAQAEVRQSFGKNANVEESRLGELNYLQMVIKETLRLYPPVPLLIPRESREGCLLSGYQIPPKTRVIVNAWAIGRDPNYWNEADRFNPERFLDNGIDYKGTNFELIPFGAGRRMCPGINFGTTGVQLALANMLYYFDWKLPGGIKAESLDMQEKMTSALRRRSDLELIAVQCNTLSFA